MKGVFVSVILLLSITVASAATIKGSVYGPDFEDSTNALIKINTTPEQQYLSRTGSYSFSVPIGRYRLEAKDGPMSTVETITINDNGEYIIDLLLFPTLQEVQPYPDLNLEESKSNNNGIILTILVALLIIGFLVGFIWKSKKTKTDDKTDDEYYGQILKFIKQHKRTTQKDIRKEIPLSEAKISLVLTEMENRKIIKKIKKGRGNIIILN